jgi:hypothetical protein
MKKALSQLYPVVAGLLIAVQSSAQVTQTLGFTGTMQSFTVPVCVVSVSADVRGAQGGGPGGAPGGLGGRAQAVFTVTPGEVLQIWVGGAGTYVIATATGGFNGGAGHANMYPNTTLAGTGGGGSDIRRNPGGYTNRIVVGGGGGGGADSGGQNRAGGSGGGMTGGTGGAWNSWPLSGGQGGSQTAGGAAGVACCQTPFPGTFGVGGNGAGDGAGGGGGGGGWYGGGGGLFGGGGGGSSYVNYPGNTFTSTTSGINPGNGLVILTYTTLGNGVSISPSSTTLCTGNSVALTASGVISYTWTNNSSNIPSQVVTPASTTQYTILGTNSQGCVSSAVTTVVVHSQSISLATSTSNICLGKTVTLTASGANTYTWSGNVSNGQSYTPTVSQGYTVNATNACGTFSASTFVTVAPLPVTVAVTPTTTCAFNAATLSAIASATSFVWQPNTLTGSTQIVNPGNTQTYTLSASDGTCSGMAMVTLSVNPNPTVSFGSSTMTACAGEQITLTATGGLSYTWSEGSSTGATAIFTPTQPTLYSVTGFNQFGCSASANVAVITLAPPSFTLSTGQPVICAGGTSTLTANGNAGSYVWMPSGTGNVITVSPTASSVYTAIGSSSGNPCSGTNTIAVGVFIPSVTVTGNTVICKGGTATLTSGQANSYNWHGAGPGGQQITVTLTTGTTYTLTTVSASNAVNCPLTQMISVSVYSQSIVGIAVTRTAICRNEVISLTASGADTYTWTQGNTVSANKTFSATAAGSYTLVVNATDANGCSASGSQRIVVTACNNLAEDGLNNVLVYPNPATGDIYIRNSSGKEIHYRFTDASGKLILSGTTSGVLNVIPVADLPHGLYHVTLNEEGRIFNSTIVRE